MHGDIWIKDMHGTLHASTTCTVDCVYYRVNTNKLWDQPKFMMTRVKQIIRVTKNYMMTDDVSGVDQREVTKRMD